MSFTRGRQPPRGARGRGRGQPRGPFPGAASSSMPRVDARINDGSDVAVVDDLHRSNADGVAGLPLRPGFGTEGKPITLRANHFPVNVHPDSEIFQYNAEIVLASRDRQLTRRVKQRVFRLAERTTDWKQAGMSDRVAHDGAEKLVACLALPQPLTIRGMYYDNDDDDPPESGPEYTLSLTSKGKVDRALLNECLKGTPVDSQALAKVLSALNLVLAAHPSQSGTKVGRDDDSKKHPDQRFFFDKPEPKDIGGGLDARQGFYVSVRPAHQQLMVNVNTSHAAFYKPQNFVDALDEYGRFTRGNPLSFVNHVRVSTKPKGHVVMIRGISNKSALEHKFKHGEYGWVSITEYYKRQHDIALKHPDRPLLEGVNKGSFYPQEVCDILPDQGFKGELANKKHAKNMLDVACKLPRENAAEITDVGLDLLGFRNSNPVLDAFGIRVGTEMAVVPGRVLEKPGLSYSSKGSASIDERASWNLRDLKFAVGATLDRWAVLVIQDGGRDDFKGNQDEALQKITKGFRDMCNKSGMQVAPLRECDYATVRLPRRQSRFREDAVRAIEGSLKALVKQAAPRLVLVMLSDDDKAIYNGLKRLCDVDLDLATVCMQSSKVKNEKGRPQYYANVALKVNMKMGGINHTLDANSGTWLRSAPTMILGMDVTHPAKGTSVEGTPSIVAIVASVDEHFAQYPVALSIRASLTEIGRSTDDHLRDMFIGRFELYKARNGKLPKRVIMYRDGVSESQFVQVRQWELSEMKRAFAHFDSAGETYRPKLSIVVCGKRHHTRFYPTQAEDAARDGNPLPGTVVDRGVTPAYEFDFFLQAHGGLKGTTRPTHYYVVHDENKLSADELQRVTNDLSYMFARATKAVSLVSPAYWADIACERGRCYLHPLLLGDKDVDSGKGKGKGKLDSAAKRAAGMWGGGVAGPNLRDTMFYL